MTAREAIAAINDELQIMGGQELSNPIALRQLNSAAQEISRELRIPTRYHKDQSTEAPFAFYDDMFEGGLEYVEIDDHEINEEQWWMKPIPILSVRDANQMYPDWERNRNEGYDQFRKRIIIYDPRNKDNGIYPIGFDEGEKIRLLYVVKTEVVDLDDKLWDGRLPEWQDLVWKTVAWKALAGISSREQQSIMLYSYLRNRKEEAFNNLNDIYFRRKAQCH